MITLLQSINAYLHTDTGAGLFVVVFLAAIATAALLTGSRSAAENLQDAFGGSDTADYVR